MKRCPTQVIKPQTVKEPEKKKASSSSSSEEESSEEESSNDDDKDEINKKVEPAVGKTDKKVKCNFPVRTFKRRNIHTLLICLV